MSNCTEVITQRAITVPFHGADLYVVEHNGQPYTPMKALVAAMGLNWSGQFEKVKENEVRWGVRNIRIPSEGGVQEAVALPLRKLPGWMSTLEPKKMKSDEARARVIQYQNECDEVLWQYWNDGVAVNPRALYSVNPGDVLTKEEADALRQLVESTAKKLAGDSKMQGKFILQAWSKLKSHFKVGYREIPRHELIEAISIVNRHTVDWELVDDAPAPKPTAGAVPAIDPTDAPAMAAARKVALDYFDVYRAAVKEGKAWVEMAEIPVDALQGILAHAIMSQRMLVSFSHTTGRMNCSLVPGDSSVVSFAKDDYFDVAQAIPMERIPDMMGELNKRVACHLGAFNERLQRDRATFKQTSPGVLTRA